MLLTEKWKKYLKQFKVHMSVSILIKKWNVVRKIIHVYKYSGKFLLTFCKCTTVISDVQCKASVPKLKLNC